MRKKLLILGFALVATAVATVKPAAAHPACPPGYSSFICQSNPFAWGCCPIGERCYC
jgi:hypothetical protein